jgi:hypothetical protein
VETDQTVRTHHPFWPPGIEVRGRGRKPRWRSPLAGCSPARFRVKWQGDWWRRLGVEMSIMGPTSTVYLSKYGVRFGGWANRMSRLAMFCQPKSTSAASKSILGQHLRQGSRARTARLWV